MGSWVCTLCGYASRRSFPDDLCPACSKSLWHCGHCGRVIVSTGPPAVCAACGQPKTYTNLTPYIPDWGNPKYRAADLVSARQKNAGIFF